MRAGLAPSAAAERVAAIERYYGAARARRIERLLQTSAAEAAHRVILVTQPGRIGTPSLGLCSRSPAPVAREARATGHVTSVAPTILAALGIPVARDLASAPLLDVFRSRRSLAAHPVREVTTYGVRQLTGRSGAGQPLRQGDDRADAVVGLRSLSNFELQTSNFERWWSLWRRLNALEKQVLNQESRPRPPRFEVEVRS
jgi:hypothetical protein